MPSCIVIKLVRTADEENQSRESSERRQVGVHWSTAIQVLVELPSVSREAWKSDPSNKG